jgi:solute carrier family 25 (mitochondrial iron transporter), member 28/37
MVNVNGIRSVMTPFDTIKQRMQLGYYHSIGHCIKTIVRQEGIRALYVAFPTTLVMNIPYACIMVPTNESARKILNPNGTYNLTSAMLSGAFAGGVAAAFTNPLDVVKTRLQTADLEPCPKVMSRSSIGSVVSNEIPLNRSSVAASAQNSSSNIRAILRQPLHIVKQIWQHEGPKGFLRGLFPRMMVQSPSVAITWTTYEAMKHLLTS